MTATPESAPVGRRATQGALWLIGSRLCARGVDFVTLLVLAAILTPSDFGLVAIAMTFVIIAEAILELPLSQALVRLDTITPEHLDTAFTIAAMRGALLTVLGAVAAWPFSHFYHDARLAPLICVLSFAPAFRGLQNPALAHFALRIDFRRDFVSEVAGKVIALIAATSVVHFTHSYWAIAVATIANPLAMAAVSYLLAPYRPRLSLSQWPAFAAFLGWTSGGQVLSALNLQYDRLLLGRTIGSDHLGGYAMGSDLAAMPDQAIVRPVTRPLMAGFVALRDDPDRLQAAYLKASGALLMVTAPAMLTIGLLAGPFVHAILGSKWAIAGSVLQWLAISWIAPTWTASLLPLSLSVNRTRIFLAQNTIELCLKTIIMTFAIIYYGINGAIFSRLIINIILMIISMHFVRTIIRTSVAMQICQQWRTLLASSIISVFLLKFRYLADGADKLSQLSMIASIGVAGVALYCITLMVLWILSGKPDGLEKDLALAIKERKFLVRR